MKNITIGADPELFLECNGEFKSAIDRIGGIKTAPRPLGREGFFVQEDNVAVEFNIPPAKTVEAFVESIQWSLSEIAREVEAFGFKPCIKAAALFPPSELVDPRALAFGCEPDFNAWNHGLTNPKPHSAHYRLRSCGGHVHVGYPKDSGINRHRLVQLMDLYLGVPSILMDDDQERRQLYGKAGCFRGTDYGGTEYRVLSNFWLKKPEYQTWVFEQTHRAIDRLMTFGPAPVSSVHEPDEYDRFMEGYDLCDDIQGCINHSDPTLAQKLVAHHDLAVV